MRFLIFLVFIMWLIYIIKITKETNEKYFLLIKDIHYEMERKKYRNKIIKQHLIKVFLGLLVVLVLFLFSVYIQLNFINQ